MASCMSEDEQSPQFVSKRKKSSEHQWTDSDVPDLIYMWQQEEFLYNTKKNKNYHNSTKQSRAIKIISVEIHVAAEEVTKRMVGLRSCSGQLKQKVTSSKKMDLELIKFLSRNGLFMTIWTAF